MHEELQLNYVSLLIITLLAFFIPILVTRIPKISIPIVVGEILAGMIVGKSGLDIIGKDAYLTFLSNFGFAYLMFLSGLEIDFSMLSRGKGSRDLRLRERVTSPVALSLLVFVSTLIASLMFAYILKMNGLVESAMLMALILSTTSLGVVVPILKEEKRTGTDLGQTILLTALIADFGTMLLITVVASIAKGGNTAEVLIILILFVAFFFIYRITKLFRGLKIIEKLSHATSQIRVRGAFALVLVFVALAQQMGKEVIILGAFLAGVIISLLSNRHGTELHMKLDAIGYGFFIPIFFIMVGVNFEIRELINSPGAILLVVLLLVQAYIVKMVPSLFFKLRYSWKETLGSGFLLSSRLSLIIAASAIGVELNLISSSVNSAIILVAIVTVTLSPMLYHRVIPKLKEQDEKQIVVIGVSETGLFLAKQLKRSYDQVVHLAVDEKKLGLVKDTSIERLPKKFDNLTETLSDIGLDRAHAVVVATAYDDYNERIASELVGFPQFERIFAIMTDENRAKTLEAQGVQVVRPSMATELVLENLIKNPEAFALLTEDRKARVLKECKVESAAVHGNKIQQLSIPKSILFLSVKRGDDSLVPHGDTKLRYGDWVTFVGPPDDCERTLQILQNGKQ